MNNKKRIVEAYDILKIVDKWKDYPITMYNYIQEYYYQKNLKIKGIKKK